MQIAGKTIEILKYYPTDTDPSEATSYQCLIGFDTTEEATAFANNVLINSSNWPLAINCPGNEPWEQLIPVDQDGEPSTYSTIPWCIVNVHYIPRVHLYFVPGLSRPIIVIR